MHSNHRSINMTRHRITLVDEVSTKQEHHIEILASTGADVEVETDSDDDEIAWGADPYLILAAKEAHGEH